MPSSDIFPALLPYFSVITTPVYKDTIYAVPFVTSQPSSTYYSTLLHLSPLTLAAHREIHSKEVELPYINEDGLKA